MKSKYFTKSVFEIADIMDRCLALQRKMLVETGRNPAGFVMGPNEYLSLFNQVQDAYGSMRICKHGQPHLFDLPVLVKQAPGIELLIPYDMVTHFAIGLVAPRERDHDDEPPSPPAA